MKRSIFLSLGMLVYFGASGTTWTINTSGFAFNPANITIISGDDVTFNLNNTSHDAVEVSQDTYNANGTSPLSGGFSFPLGVSGTVTKLKVGTHYFVCTPHVASFGMKGTIEVQNSNCTTPSTPTSITGNTSACFNSLNTYSIPAVPGATAYTWTLPSGWTGNSTTTSLNVTAGAFGGSITVTANNSCGNSAPASLTVITATVPAQPLPISGNSFVCINSSNSYTITSVSGALSYIWTLPSGWSGSSTSNSINALSGSSGGMISVTANNTCGPSPAQSLQVTTSGPPNQPGNIAGNTVVCTNSTNSYSVVAVPGAALYSWTLPSGWSGSSNTNSITALSSLNGGAIAVSATGSCGTSISRLLNVTTSAPPPAPVILSGNTTVCANSIYMYSIAAISGASTYTWTLPSGWKGTSVTNSIEATAGTLNGNISVTANNTCGASLPQSISVISAVQPNTPGAIEGNTSVCANSSNVYSVLAVPGATSYTWVLPNGWSGNSNTNTISILSNSTGGTIKVTANNTCGSSLPQPLNITVNSTLALPASIVGNASVCAGSVNTYSVDALSGATSYTWGLPTGWTGNSTTNSITAVAGSLSGTITIVAKNSCSASAAQTLATIVNTVPPQPASIKGNSSVCANSMNEYSVDAVPGASYYTWVMPPGWTINSTSNFITTITSMTGGTITIAAINLCGASSKQSLPVTINQVNKQVTQSGTVLTASATGAAYQWIDCTAKTPIAGQTNKSFTAAAVGSYAVILSQNNCMDTSSCFAVGTVVNRELNSTSGLTVFPNPSAGIIQIELKQFERGTAELYNALGEKIMTRTIKSLNTTIDLSYIPRGIYFLNFYLGHTVFVKKIFKE